MRALNPREQIQSKTMEEKVILVNDQDEEISTMEKMQVHRAGLLHRAFSIFIFNSKKEMLLQQRAFSKYHCGGLWTNACCSHPRKGETVLQAAHRRLQEEFGFDCPLKESFSFIYKADVGGGLIEHEFDHVIKGEFEGPILNPNPQEINSYCWYELDTLQQKVKQSPETFTVWFRIILERVLASS